MLAYYCIIPCHDGFTDKAEEYQTQTSESALQRSKTDPTAEIEELVTPIKDTNNGSYPLLDLSISTSPDNQQQESADLTEQALLPNLFDLK